VILLAVALTLNSAVIAADERDEAQAIREIKRLGGRTKRDEKLPGRPVTEVHFSYGSQFWDDDFRLLKPLAELTTLELYGSKICGTRIVGSGLRKLGRLKKLTTLILRETKITDTGLKQISEIKSLTTLNLSFAHLTDAGLTEFKGFKNLTTLSLDGTGITDAGLKVLGELKNLKNIQLNDTAITDSGLKELRQLKNLKAVGLWRTRTTDIGVKELQLCLPTAEIHR
jgi:hypothetical protein